MNDEGVAMLEDNIFCTREFAEQNPETVKSLPVCIHPGLGVCCGTSGRSGSDCV